jgi:ABC-type nitrate/sulfonate/bicarbonate transport system substrate-binding protein
MNVGAAPFGWRGLSMRIAAVDLVSNTCFPLLAADELGLFEAEGLDVEIELLPMLRGTQALRDGTVDLMAAGSVYDVLTEFPGWKGAKVVVALCKAPLGCWWCGPISPLNAVTSMPSKDCGSRRPRVPITR